MDESLSIVPILGWTIHSLSSSELLGKLFRVWLARTELASGLETHELNLVDSLLLSCPWTHWRLLTQAVTGKFVPGTDLELIPSARLGRMPILLAMVVPVWYSCRH